MDGPFLVSARCLKVANAATTLPVVRLMIRPDVCDVCRVSVSSSTALPLLFNSFHHGQFSSPPVFRSEFIYDLRLSLSFSLSFDSFLRSMISRNSIREIRNYSRRNKLIGTIPQSERSRSKYVHFYVNFTWKSIEKQLTIWDKPRPRTLARSLDRSRAQLCKIYT